MARGLKDKIVSIPLDAGLEAGSEPKVLSATPIKLENCEFNRGGVIEKRSGRNRSAAADNTMTSVYPADGRLVASGSGKIRTYSDAAAWSNVVPGNAVHTYGLSVAGAVGTSKRPEVWDYAEADDFYTVIYQQLDDNLHVDTFVSLFDKATNELLYTEEIIARQGSVRALSGISADEVYVYWVHSDGIRGRSFDRDGSTGYSQWGLDIPSSVGDGAFFDACVVPNSGNPYAVLFYRYGTPLMRAAFVEGGLWPFPFSTTDIDTGASYSAVCACFAASDDTVQFVWHEPATPNLVRSSVWDLTPSESVGPGTVTSHAASVYASNVPRAIAGTQYAANASNTTVYVSFQYPTDSGETNKGRAITEVVETYDNSGNIDGTASGDLYGSMLAAKPGAIDSENGIAVPVFVRSWDTDAQDTSFDSVYVVKRPTNVSASTNTHQLVAKMSYGACILPCFDDYYDGSFENMASLPSTVLSSNTFIVPHVRQTLGSRLGGGYVSRWTTGRSTSAFAIVLGKIDTAAEPDHAFSDGILYISGCVPLIYDGSSVFEHGFHRAPDAVYVTASNYGATMDPDTYHGYRVTYERVDRNGNRHQSCPTIVDTGSTTDSNGSGLLVESPGIYVSIGGDNARADGYDSPVSGILWRAQTGGPYTRVGSAGDNTVAYMDEIDTVTATDYERQSMAKTTEVLYTDTGQAEATVPPASSATHIWESRHFCVDSENPETIVRYSKKKTPGRSFEHNEIYFVSIPERGGNIVALSDMLDKLIVLKERSVYTVEGEGLSDSGGGAGYAEPYSISDSVGCSVRDSVVRIPQGIAFVSQDGSIWLVNQSMGLKNIGDAVRYYTDTYTVVRGVSVPDKNLAVWFTSDGPAIVYNWLRDKWCTWTNHDAVDAAVVGSDLYWLDSDGYVWSEDSSNYDDNNTYVPMKVETGWINVPQIGGYGRVREIALIGYFRQDCQLRIRAAYNGDPAWDDNLTYDLDTLEPFDYTDYYGAGLTLGTYTDQAMVLKVYTSRRRMTSLRLSISDEQSDGGPASSKGFSLVAAALRVAAKPGSHRVGTTRKIGN